MCVCLLSHGSNYESVKLISKNTIAIATNIQRVDFNKFVLVFVHINDADLDDFECEVQ